jgi:hypothetical protein
MKDRLGPTGMAEVVQRYRDGMTLQQIAEKFASEIAA